jgi:replicative DNA helicase
MKIDDRLPPHNKDAEENVLGSMIRHNPCIADVLTLLDAEKFYFAQHRMIFNAIVAMWDRSEAVDLVTMAHELNTRGQIEDIGGYAKLAELWDAAPTAGNAMYFARILRGQALMRNLEGHAHDTLRFVGDRNGSPEDLVEDAERRLFAIAHSEAVRGPLNMDVVSNNFYMHMDAVLAAGGVSGLPTGLADLDEKLMGLHKSEMTIIGARPGVGKTALGTAFAMHTVLESKRACLFVSLEMSHLELYSRMACALANVNSQKIRAGKISQDELRRIAMATEQLRAAQLFIDDEPSQTAWHIAAHARRLKARVDLGLVVVDYIQLIESTDRRSSRREQLEAISRRMKILAKELQVPVVCMAQLNREAEDREPRLGDLRESGALEADADCVIMLHRDRNQENNPVPEIQAIVAKQRNGPTGKVVLGYDKQHTKFVNISHHPEA